MNDFFNIRSWIITFVAFALCGCSSVNERHIATDRSAYYPLAVISDYSKPKLAIHALDTVFDGNKAECFARSFVVLSPICMGPAAVMDNIAESQNEDIQDTFNQKVKALEPRSKLPELVNQQMLRNQTMDYLAKRHANAQDLNFDDPPLYFSIPEYTDEIYVEDITIDKSDVDYEVYVNKYLADKFQSLYRQGYPMILEMSLLSVELGGRNMGIDGSWVYALCLEMQAQARIIKSNDSRTVDIKKARSGVCKPLQEWLPEGVLEAEITYLYSTLSSSLLDEILFIYGMPQDNIIGLSPITPKVLIEETRSYQQQNTPFKPLRQQDLVSRDNGLLFTTVGEKPRFEWSAFSESGVTDVRYELRIFKGRQDMLVWPKSFLTGWDYLPLYQYIRPDDMVYSHDNLTQTSYELDMPLEPCGWYFWTVRASFKVSGYPRVTHWSKARTSHWNNAWGFFPIRTPPVESDFLCREKIINWGPLK